MSRAGKLARIFAVAAFAWPGALWAQSPAVKPSDRAWKKAFLLTRAGDAYATGKLPEAEQLFRSVLRVDPKDEVALRHLAALAIKKSDKASAVLLLTRATDAHPESFAAQHELGGLLLGLGRAAEAAQHFSAAIKAKPDFLDAYVNYGDCLALTAKRKEAVHYYERALEIDPSSAWAHRQLGTSLFELGRSAEALPHLEIASRRFTHEAPLFLVLGHARYLQGNDASALDAYDSAGKINPRFAVAYVFKGNVLAKMGEIAQAEEAYKKAIQLDPKEPLAHVHLGNLYRQRNAKELARRQYQSALKSKPQFLWALIQLGFLSLEEGKHKEAQKLLEQALKLAPNNPDVGVALGDSYQIEDRPDLADAYYRRVLSSNPTHLGALIKLADSLARRGKLAEALDQYRKAAAAHPNSAWALIVLGDCEKLFGQFASARGHYLAAMKVDPGSRWAQRQLGFLLFDLGEDVEAANLLKRVATASPKEVDVYLTLGHLERRRQNLEEAAKHYQHVASIDPRNARAKMFLAEISRLRGKPREAIPQYQEALELDPQLLDAWVLLGDAAWSMASVNGSPSPAADAREPIALARQAYGKAVALDERAPWPRRQLGFMAYYTGDLALAQEMLASVQQTYPLEVEIPLILGHIAFANERFSQAAELYGRAMVLAPTDVRPFVFAGRALARIDRLAEALATLQKAVAVDPNSAWAWLELGFVQHRLKDLKGALKSARSSVQLNDQAREAWLFLGGVEQGSGAFSEAINAYRRAIALSPDHAYSHRALASALYDRSETDDLDEAQREIERALDGLGDDAFTHLIAGHIYTRLSQRAAAVDPSKAKGLAGDSTRGQALAHFHRAIELQSDDPLTRISIASGFFDLEDYRQSRQILVPVLEVNEKRGPQNEWELTWNLPNRQSPDPQARTPEALAMLDQDQLHARARLISGDLYMREKAELPARLEYARAVWLWPDNPEGHLHLGSAYEKAGMVDLASEHYLAAAMIDPHSIVAKRGLERVRKEAGIPAGSFRLSGLMAAQSDPIPVEIIARQAQSLSFTQANDQRQLLTVPTTLRLTAGVAYDNATWRRMPRLQLDYDYLYGISTFLNDRLAFENTNNHAATARAVGRISALRTRRAELTYDASIRLLTGTSQSRSELRESATFSARLVEVQRGSIELSAAYEHGNYKLVLPGSGDTVSNGALLQLRVVPALRSYQLEGAATYQAQALWLTPSRRQLWMHSLAGEASRRIKSILLGGELRLGLTTDRQLDSSAPKPTIFSTTVTAKGGYFFSGETWVLGRVGFETPWGNSRFDSLRAGAQASHRILWPKTEPMSTGVLFSLGYEIRYAYNLGRFDSLFLASIFFAR